ncbi:MAG: FAD-dependent oxidoreductase [Verrucomicrobia bacterium]|nr:FAD-dependent oxidoreductase [Verrucomicrobiota bacterium]
MPKEVIIIGGGMAGLSAAAELRGCRVTLVEAKNRFGGRIHTLYKDGNVIELGAEFVHGQNKALLSVIHNAGLALADASERNQMLVAGRLQPIALWDKFGELAARIETQKPDKSFLSFIDETALDEGGRKMMLTFVAGFDAADPARISAHSLRRAEYASEQMNGQKEARLQTGYASLAEFMESKARHSGATLLKNVVVHAVRWRRGRVQVEASCDRLTETFLADAAIVTLPLGVLKARAVTFEPALPDKEEAVAGLEFGNAIKLTLVFRRPWWPDPDFGFIHTLDESLQTWWSDSRGPILTGWAGGPKADALLNHSPAELEVLAVEALSRLFSISLQKIRTELISSHTHNWAHDPHIRGAYSYIPVGGLFYPKQLGAPVKETLFFAGEATARDGQMGTVFAALESGQRVARELMNAI